MSKTKWVTQGKFRKKDDYVVACKIQQRRLQMLIHSYIYYRMDDSIISDHQWSAWAKELVELQKTYPKIADKVAYAEDFKNFDGSTGFDLPLDDEYVIVKATELYRLHKERAK